MRTISKLITCILFIFNVILYGSENTSEYNKNWPIWRGPLATGEAPSGNPPIEWNENKNIRWKIPIAGKGLSTPVTWNDQLFITTAVELKKIAESEKVKLQKENRPLWLKLFGMSNTTENIQQYVIYSISRKSGKVLWKKVVREDLPHEGTHKDGSWASNSCVTDGEYVIAFFGSFGLFCFDLQGNLIWEKDLGDMKIISTFGEGSSPALYEDYVIINWDHEGASFIITLNKKTGDVIWEKERDEGTTWSTPLVVEVNGKPQVIVSASGHSRGYDLATGEIIWKLGGLTPGAIPSPVYSDGMIYLMSGFRGNALQAIKLDIAKGDLQQSPAIVWTHDENTPYVPSPLLYHGKLYFLNSNKEQLTCVDAKTGEIHYTKQKLKGIKGVYASPVGANGRVYVAGRNGVSYVIEAGPVYKMLAKNDLTDRFDSSPAIVGDELFLRGLKYLYCISAN